MTIAPFQQPRTLLLCHHCDIKYGSFLDSNSDCMEGDTSQLLEMLETPGNRVSGLQDRQQAQVNEKPMKARKRNINPSPSPIIVWKKDCGHAITGAVVISCCLQQCVTIGDGILNIEVLS